MSIGQTLLAAHRREIADRLSIFKEQLNTIRDKASVLEVEFEQLSKELEQVDKALALLKYHGV
jgi:predicted  nucleic acid-binding Zn-ribbon protein